MNRLIIIGNGFDLAHGLPTAYSDFLLYYLKTVFKERNDSNGLIEFVKTSFQNRNWKKDINETNTIKELLSFTEKYNRFLPYTIKSHFLSQLLNTTKNYNWVDIEGKYYELLTKHKYKSNIDVFKLNNDFTILKNALEDYLTTEVDERYDFKPKSEFLNIFKVRLKKVDFSEQLDSQEKDKIPNKTLFLNFNYTKTLDFYVNALKLKFEELNFPFEGFEMNRIHGKLNYETNPIIFGFGDEIDEKYKQLEELNDNEYFRHIKSFQYFKSTNNQNLNRFLKHSDFQVFVIGHSCGLSDRTLLNHIFENEKCKSIKLFYYEDLDNFVNMTYEVSRHFSDKSKMRLKIVPFPQSQKMPQVPLEKIELTNNVS